MKNVKIIYIFVIITSLFGCAQKIPTYDTGYGLVAVPYNFKNSTNTPLLYTYELRSSTDAQFSVKIQQNLYHKDVSLSEPIKEGKYTIDAMILRSVLNSKVEHFRNEIVHKIEVPFDINVYDGEIVLVPFVFEVKQYQNGDEIYCIPSTVVFNDELEKFYSERLKNKENIEQWKMRIL